MPLLTTTPTAKFLLDENVNRRVSVFLAQKGFDVTTVPKGLKNGNVIRLSKQEQRILVTHDTDFANPTYYKTENIHSVIVLQIHPPVFDKLTTSLEKFLENIDSVVGKRFLLYEDSYTLIE